jgi:TetR/AcrR family transcriptional repressor of lmrAB and yxaGH operons
MEPLPSLSFRGQPNEARSDRLDETQVVTARAGTRRLMIEGAKHLFRLQGYSATSMREIWEYTQTPRGSVYFNFPGGKQELGREVLASILVDSVGIVRAAGAETSGPAAFVHRLLGKLAHELELTDCTEGHVIGTLGLEMCIVAPDLRPAVEQALGGWERSLVDELERKGIQPVDATRLGSAMASAIEGAVVVAKTRKTISPLNEIGRIFSSLVDAA